MAFTGASSTQIASFLTEYITPFAMSVLRGRLDILKDVPQIPLSLADIQHKNKVVSVPIIGTLSSNTRAELDEVVDQVPSATDATGTYAEEESTFVFDDVAKAMLNPANVNAYIEAAVKAVTEKLVNNTYTAMAAGAGSSIGSGAAAVSYANFIAPAKTLTDNLFPEDDRVFHVSPTTDQTIMSFTEYGALFGYNGMKQAETVDGRVMAGFMMRKTPFLTGTTNRINLAFHKSAVAQVFVPQENQSDFGIVKRTLTVDDMSLSIAVQSVDKGNGSLRWTVSVRHAPIVIRGSGIVAVDSLA